MLPLFLLLSPPLAHSHADAVAEFRSLTISKQRAYTVEKDDVRLGLWQSYYELSRKFSKMLFFVCNKIIHKKISFVHPSLYSNFASKTIIC